MGELKKRIDKSSFRILEAKVDTSNPKVAKVIGDFIGNINVINTEKAKMIVVEMRKDFLKIYPKDELGGTLREYIDSLKRLVEVEEKMGRVSREDKRQLRLLLWFVEWLGEDEQ